VTQRPQSNDSAKLATRMMATVTRKNVEWVWRDRIAFGKPCLVAGDPGEGKSTMLCQVAAMISRGGKLPDDDEVRPPKDVLIISAEDDPEDTVWDRLAAANADMDRIFWVDGVSRDADGKPVGFFNVTTDLDRLEGTLTEPGKDFALVILDPFDAYLGGQVDTHRSASVRDATGPFQKLLERTHVGGACVLHLNKGAGTKASYRVQGSIAFFATTRQALLVSHEPDGEDDQVRHVVGFKNSNGPKAAGLSFRIDAMTGNFRWGVGTTTMTDGQLLREPTRNEAEDGDTADASDVLRDLLANGPVEVELARKTVMTTAGVSLRTVGSVKRRLKVKSTHPGGRGPWYWELPEADSRARTRAGNNPNVAPLPPSYPRGQESNYQKEHQRNGPVAPASTGGNGAGVEVHASVPATWPDGTPYRLVGERA
jgi:hypothetical protein